MFLLDMIAPIIFFVCLMSLVGLRFLRAPSGTLVLQTFRMSVAPRGIPEPTVEIVGRRQGVVAFVLSLMGFSPITRFTIAGPEVRCQSSSLFGQRSQFIPLRCVTSLAGGVHKPIAMLIWAVIVIVAGSYMSYNAGSWMYFAISQVIGIALVVTYILTKKFFIEIHCQGGPAISLLFKPNVLEGVPIDVAQALEVVDVIRELILIEGSGGSRAEPEQESYVPNEETTWEPTDPGSEEDDERQAKHWYAQARQYAQAGQARLAIATLKQLVQKFPETGAAEQARRSLEKSGS